MTSLPAPLFEPNRITTLIAPVDNELAALVAALAVLNDARTALAPSLMLGAIRAFYSAGAQHPHLQGGTVGDWALNLFDEEQAAAELPTLRAIASADIHNLVFQRDYRIIPAMLSGRIS
jgi:hypothetical protein